jgi:signal transduction histidine kinase
MTVAFHRQELANETDKGLKILGSFLEQTDVQQTENGAAESAAGNANSIAVANGANGNTWHFECGPASEVLEFTRGQIFDELLRLRDDERQRIGQELHDSAGQLLLSLQLDVALLRATEKTGQSESLICEIEDTARLIGQEIRSLAFLNHPVHMDPSGLGSALQALISGFGKRTGCRVSFEVSGDARSPSRTSSMALLRVAQEALVNVHRHAHASCVTAKLERRGSSIELTISDDGVGMPSRKELAMHGGVGVEGMRFRVERLGGRFHIAKLKHGTKISVSVPRQPADQA